MERRIAGFMKVPKNEEKLPVPRNSMSVRLGKSFEAHATGWGVFVLAGMIAIIALIGGQWLAG